MKNAVFSSHFFAPPKLTLNWRILWYSVLIWLLGFLVSAVVMLPWYYLALPIVIVLTTSYYFKVVLPKSVKRGRRPKTEVDRIFAYGLGAAIAWFAIIAVLTVFEIAGFYYFNFSYYFSDFRVWYLYFLVILMPVLYGLILENSKFSRKRRRP